MAAVPAKVASRVSAGLKKFQPLLEDARKRDLNESDTVTLVVDVLNEVFGYEKYGEITSEHSIRSTFCDLAIKLDGDLVVLIEVKAIGLELKDNYIRQAVDYAANQGCVWVVLTNGVLWRAYQVAFTKPIEAELVLDLNLLELNHRKGDDIEMLALLSREAWQKSRLDDYAIQKQALSRFTIASVLLSEPCLQMIRRELRRISRDVRIGTSDIEKVLLQDVIKREALEGEKADAAKRLVARAARRALRATEGARVPAKPPSGATQA
jgi:predicted type IV restriction endonuclease